MRRIGLLVAILAALLLVGLGMLVTRALDSVERERAMRHEVLAERVFDELEEQLTELTEREEARPFLQYRFFYVPEGQVTQNPALSRSPLSEPPEDDWLVGWFQLDPDGGVTTPYEPDDAQLAADIGWSRWDDLDHRVARLQEIAQALPVRAEDRRVPLGGEGDDRVAKTGETKRIPQPSPDPEPTVRPASTSTKRKAPAPKQDAARPGDGMVSTGTTAAPSTTSADRSDRKEAMAKKDSALAQASDPYGIGSLNKGALRRGERQQRVTKSNAENVRSYQFPEDNQAILNGDTTLPEVEFPRAADQVAEVVVAEVAQDQERRADRAEDSWDLLDTDDGDAVSEGAEEAAASPREAALEDSSELDVSGALHDAQGSDGREEAGGAGRARRSRNRVPAPATRKPTAPSASRAPEPQSEVGFDAGLDPVAETGSVGGKNEVASDSLPEVEEKPPAPIERQTEGPARPTESPAPVARFEPTVVQKASPPPPPPAPRAAAAAPVRAPKATAVLTPRTPAAAEDGEVDVEISPFRGHRVDDDTMVLYRTVRIGEVVYVQGLALLLPRLARWLEDRVLAGSEIQGFLELAWNDRGVASARSGQPLSDFTFAHTFAEPFTSLGVTSYVRALPEPRGSGRAWILQLTGLLVLVGLLGLVALWRMVSVVVHFAERRSNFVAAVSHELKTPLTAIRMYAEMLRDGYVLNEDKRAEYYATMAAESERLSRLIQNVLELSRLEKGAISGTDLVTGDVRPVLEEAVRVLERHAKDRGFSIVLDVAPDLPAVRYERDGLLQVLINLVDNGIKFSKDADPREVVIEAVPKGAGVTLRVRDHGPGVPQRQLGQIFQPFFRGERELTRRTKGTGIGLALVKGIVDRMGGSVSARNHPEGGFEVRVALVA
jgi:signal transduction histidine kinase